MVLIQIFSSYFSKGEENHKYIPKKTWWKITCRRGRTGTTALVSTVLPARTKFLIFINKNSLIEYILFGDC